MIEQMFTDIAKFIKNQGELHYICITMLKIPYTGKSRLVLEGVEWREILFTEIYDKISTEIIW